VRRALFILLLLPAASACRAPGPGLTPDPEPASLAVLQPPRLRLSTAEAYPGAGPAGYRVEAAVGDTTPTAFQLRSWHVEDDGTIRLVWSTGSVGLDLRLRLDGGDLSGPVALVSDDDPGGFVAGDAVLRRIPCGPAAAPQHDGVATRVAGPLR
jgi:hypothetical protein